MTNRKRRPTAVDEFRQSLSADQEAELMRLIDLPGIAVTEIYNQLLEWGFKGSVNSTYNWYEGIRKEGEQAKIFNAMLTAYDGVNVEPTLRKLTVVLSNHLDNITAVLTKPDIKLDPRESLRQLANIGRELRTAVTAYNELQTIRDRKGLEIAGAQRLANELRGTFKDSPFGEALEEAIKSAMILIEEDG